MPCISRSINLKEVSYFDSFQINANTRNNRRLDFVFHRPEQLDTNTEPWNDDISTAAFGINESKR